MRRFFRDGDFITYFKNTFIVRTLSLAPVSFFASLAAYAFARNKGKIYTLLYYFFIAG